MIVVQFYVSYAMENNMFDIVPDSAVTKNQIDSLTHGEHYMAQQTNLLTELAVECPPCDQSID